jgi:acetolactate synthase-1/2/3 large subunit
MNKIDNTNNNKTDNRGQLSTVNCQLSTANCQLPTVSGAEALIRSLKHHGVKTIFGYPGGSIMPTFDALYDHLDQINHILVRHEQGAAHAAQGFARVSGEVGVCLVTSGPGATNTVTGIADAMIDSTPIVVISGQVATPFLGTDFFQEVDLVGITQPISKWSYQIQRAEDVAWAVARAFYIAKSGRPGPVVLDFAKNAQVGMTEYEPMNLDFIRGYDPDPDTDEDNLQAAVRFINEAKKPLVLVGQGVELGNAQEELRRFVEKAGLPCGCTLLGLSAIPTDHPLNMGMLGMHGNLAPNVKTNECDVLIAVGMRFDDRVTGTLNTYAKQAKIIHLDIDPSEINKNVKADIPLLGNCKKTLSRLTELIRENKHTEWADSFAEHAKIEYEQVIRKEINPREGPLNMGEVIRAVSEATKNEAILVTDVGQNQMMAARYFKFSKNRSMVSSGGLGTMGFALPAAIGATFGAPGRTVCAFMGDGGLQMTIQELGAIMEQKAPVKIILLNNNFLGNVRQWQAMFFGGRYSFTPMANPDYMKIAEAYGIPSRRVAQREDLQAAIREMLQTDGPFMLEACVIEEGNVLPMTPPGYSVNQMLLEC